MYAGAARGTISTAGVAQAITTKISPSKGSQQSMEGATERARAGTLDGVVDDTVHCDCMHDVDSKRRSATDPCSAHAGAYSPQAAKRRRTPDPHAMTKSQEIANALSMLAPTVALVHRSVRCLAAALELRARGCGGDRGG